MPEWDNLTDEQKAKVNLAFINFGKAIAAYERTLVSGNAPSISTSLATMTP